MDLQQKVWPTEDFELARSMVDSPVPESDLFAGIRETAEPLSPAEPRTVGAAAERRTCRSAGSTVARRHAIVDFLAVNNFGDTRSGGLAGPMGLFIIVLMSIATVLLIRNMNKRLRRLPDSFEDAEAARRAERSLASTARTRRRPAARAHDVDGDRSGIEAGAAEPQVSNAWTRSADTGRPRADLTA